MELSSEVLLSLLSLTAMELVLGIDNLIFISILTAKLKPQEQEKTRRTGILLAVITRIGLLFAITWIMALNEPLMHLGNYSLTGKDLILFLGGAFLIVKTCIELWHKLNPASNKTTAKKTFAKASMVIIQIIMIDLIFSVDSILTAVGLVDDVRLMVAAVILSTIFMLMMANSLHAFIEKYPGFKLMALLFLIIIGGYLILESLHLPVLKAYLYCAMVFGLVYEIMHIRYRKVNEHSSN